jgi:hypothetical protein
VACACISVASNSLSLEAARTVTRTAVTAR